VTGRALADAAFDAARAAEPWALPLLAALVEENSHADNPDGQAACRRLLAGALGDLGFTVEERVGQAGDTRRAHLYAHAPAADAARPTLLLLGHLDTVFPREHAFQRLQRDGERWHGPGVSDMKGGIVTALVTVAALRALGAAGRANLRLFLCGDEEIGSPTGAPLLVEAARGADLALCFEAAREGGELVTARKGYGSARVVVHGKSGHAGIHHARGVNALTVLSRFVLGAEALEAGHDDLSVSPGGKVAVSPAGLSIIPDRAEAELEFRFFDAAVGDAVPAQLRALGEALGRETGARLEVEARVETPPMPETERTRGLLARYVDAAAALGLQTGGVATAGVGDINLVAAEGVTCLDGVGPEGGGFHTDREYLLVPSIARRAAMNAAALAGLLA
jgi:glutamate carboxypeptidase